MAFISINGRLTKDPKRVVRKTKNGDVEVTELTIACNPMVGNVRYSNYYHITVWPGRFEGILNCLNQGSAITAYGILYIASYKDKNGDSRTSNNVNLMHLSFPVADTEEMAEKRKKKKVVKDFMDDNAAIEGPDGGPDNSNNQNGDNDGPSGSSQAIACQ